MDYQNHGPRAFAHEFPEFEEVEDPWWPWRWWFWRLFLNERRADAMEDQLQRVWDRWTWLRQSVRRDCGRLVRRATAGIAGATQSIIWGVGGVRNFLWRFGGSQLVWPTALREPQRRRRGPRDVDEDPEHMRQLLELDWIFISRRNSEKLHDAQSNCCWCLVNNHDRFQDQKLQLRLYSHWFDAAFNSWNF